MPKPVSEEAVRMVEEADGMLVCGSSLQVFSAYRLVRRASDTGKPIAILNIGPTRADDRADLRIEATLAATLTQLVPLMHGKR